MMVEQIGRNGECWKDLIYSELLCPILIWHFILSVQTRNTRLIAIFFSDAEIKVFAAITIKSSRSTQSDDYTNLIWTYALLPSVVKLLWTCSRHNIAPWIVAHVHRIVVEYDLVNSHLSITTMSEKHVQRTQRVWGTYDQYTKKIFLPDRSTVELSVLHRCSPVSSPSRAY
jgi:hypothetical protein